MNLNESAKVFSEELRPEFHFTPAKNWINDPNGLIFYKGKYHIFYQHNPNGILWGDMSWGHSVSTDLIHWEHLPVAIPFTPTSGIFSGSAVLDAQNTTGFGSTENPPLVAIYTVHQNDASNQSQHIAYSLDEGATWINYEKNPVLDLGMVDFRDPKVSWDENTQSWLMTVAKPLEYKIAFFSSKNLIDWQPLSEFGPQGGTDGCWECPDLFPLISPEGKKVWVLIVSLNPGGVAGGSGTQYFIGDWDGRTFTTTQTETLWIDYGRDNYAGVTYSNLPEGERIFIGWMSNWDYAAKLDSQIWRGSMTTPRRLQIIDTASGARLSALPFQEKIGEHDFTVEMNTHESREFIFGDETNYIKVFFDSTTKKISLDRTHSWFPEFEERIQTTPPVMEEKFSLRFLFDHGSLELFCPEAALAITSQTLLPASCGVLQNTAKALQ